MNRSTNNHFQEILPGGPSPDYESTEAQHKATSASGEATVPNSQTLTGAPGITSKEGVDSSPVVSRQPDVASAQSTGNTPSDPAPQEGVDVLPGHSVVSRQPPDLASAQSTGNTSAPQPALYEGERPSVRGSPPEPSSGATPAAVAADPRPVLSEDSGYISRGPSDAARLRLENLSPSPKAPTGRDDAQRSVSLASRRTNRSLAANGSAFANGTATTTNGPPDVDPSLQARAASAEDELKPRDKTVISKEENSVGRKLSKIVRKEARTGKASLDVALGELCEIQKLQKASIKDEAESHTRHSRALSDAHKAEMKLLFARTANEREQAGLRAAGEELEVCHKHAREATDMLRDKMHEVERLRMHKGVDDRERAVKVKTLVSSSRFGSSG